MHLRKKIFQKAPDFLKTEFVIHKLPRDFTIEVTNVCNLRCPLCPTLTMRRDKRMMSYGEFEHILDQIKAYSRSISFYLLGEPLVNKDLFKMIRECKKNDIRTKISSNTMLVDRYIDEIFESGLDSIQLTLDGIDGETHERYRVGSDFKRVISNIKLLVKEKRRRQSNHPTITLQTIVFRFNEDQIDDIINFAREVEVDHMNLKAVNLFEDRGSDEEKLFEYVPQNGHKRYFIGEERYYRDSVCPQLFAGAILANGDVVPCCFDVDGEYILGNVFQEDFERIWKNQKHRKFLREYFDRSNQLCKTCNLMEDIQHRVF